MSNNALMIWVRTGLDTASNRYPVPVLLMLRSSNVATPLMNDRVVVPDNTLPPGLVLKETMTLPEKAGSVLPNGSCAATSTSGLIVVTAVVVVGCCVNPSFVAAACVMVKIALVPAVHVGQSPSTVLIASSVCGPTKSMLTALNVATPAVAVAVAPDRMVPGPEEIVSVTLLLVNPVATLSNASRA